MQPILSPDEVAALLQALREGEVDRSEAAGRRPDPGGGWDDRQSVWPRRLWGDWLAGLRELRVPLM
jgi:hypothetical protein